MNLSGQVAIVTGGGRGLGRAYALALAAAGAAVAVTARTVVEIQSVAHAIEQNGGRALTIAADVTEQKAVTQMVTAVEQKLGSVTLLVNNAGVLRAIGRMPKSKRMRGGVRTIPIPCVCVQRPKRESKRVK